jgi:hypothetical protein
MQEQTTRNNLEDALLTSSYTENFLYHIYKHSTENRNFPAAKQDFACDYQFYLNREMTSKQCRIQCSKKTGTSPVDELTPMVAGEVVVAGDPT